MKLCLLILLVIKLSEEYSQDEGKCLVDREEVTPKKYLVYKEKSQPIIIETSSRITHQLSSHIFKIYIEEVLGYPKVVINQNEDDFQIENVMERLSDANVIVPPATINLEVWASADYDTFAKELVKESGNIGPPGRFGWFIPLEFDLPIRQYYKKYLWDDLIREVHWSFFLNPQLVANFDIPEHIFDSLVEQNGYNREHSENGEYVCPSTICRRSMYIPQQCQNQQCAVLLAPLFNSSKFLIDQIDETRLLVKILWLGNNLSKTLRDLKLAYNSENRVARGILIFHWFPSEVIQRQENYISVQFKNNELYNFTMKNTTGFKYEMHRLVKMSWGRVQEQAYPLYVGLRHFKFQEKDYQWLLKSYDDPQKSIRQIACDWMKFNNETWEHWKVNTDKAILYIGGIFPLTFSSYNGSSIVRAAELARKAINKNTTILPDYELRMITTDGQCSPDKVMKEFISFLVEQEYYTKLAGVLGPACSDTVEPIAGVSKHYRIMIMSYSAEGSSFSDRSKYPYFFRTIGENKHYKHVYLALFDKFEWKRVAALTEDGQKYTEYISLMQEDLEKHKIEFIANKKFPRERKMEDMKWHLEDLKNKNSRIIIADVVDDVARTVMCEAYKLEMTAKQGYVWFLPVWLNSTWYDTDLFNKNSTAIINCTTKEMIEAITGYFSMTHAYYAPDNSMMQENITVGEWREKNKHWIGGSAYAGFAYDALWTYALALNKLAANDSEALSTMHSLNSTEKLVRIIEATDFYGVSGRIKFRGGPSRFSIINILQWYDNASHLVGYFNPNLTDNLPEILGGDLIVNDSIRWFTEDGKIPKDGTIPPPSCAIETLAKFFDVECQIAMIILNMIIASVLLIVVIAVCYYWKRRYDRKVEKTKTYIRSLGLTIDLNYDDLNKWEISRTSVVINRKLGEGAFGTVYGGEAQLPGKTGWTAVAVKTLKIGSTPVQKLDFLSEAEAMKRFDHKNIVTLLGVCTKDEPIYTIMEFMLYGDLKVYLLGRRHLVNSKDNEESEDVSPKRLTNMALDVAQGLKYLADLNYVHRDIASRNCLVNEQRCVKIGDFGMTRAMQENDYYRFQRKGWLPVRWMSPESLDSGIFTTATDIWSYGVLLYEIITFGSFPFQGKSNTEVLQMVKNGQVLDIPKRAKPNLENLMRSCWQKDPGKRPTASQIVDYLSNNPRLLSPCLDTPTSSVPIENDQLDMSPQKDSLPNNTNQNGTVVTKFQVPTTIYEDKNEGDIPLEICCPKEPLLGQSVNSNSLSHISRRDSGDDDDMNEYANQSIIMKKRNTNV